MDEVKKKGPPHSGPLQEGGRGIGTQVGDLCHEEQEGIEA